MKIKARELLSGRKFRVRVVGVRRLRSRRLRSGWLGSKGVKSEGLGLGKLGSVIESYTQIWQIFSYHSLKIVVAYW